VRKGSKYGQNEGIPKLPIIQYWHSPEIPDEVAASIATFRDRNRELRHLIFDEASAEDFIARHLTAREVASFRACAVPAMQADYLRYCAVLVLGGVYADVSLRCLRPLQSLIETTDTGMLFRQDGARPYLGNRFFLFKAPGQRLPRLALDVATVNIETRAAEQVNMVTGPWIFNALEAIRRSGSLEAARRLVVSERAERLADSVKKAVGSYELVAEAFDGVQIAQLATIGKWIESPATPPAYKESETRWVGWQKREGTIFR
jgi:mannosyltransferase OCH1-like enzyme